MEKIKVRVINRSNNQLPEYGTSGAAGMDVRASLNETITIAPMERALIPTGLYVEIPEGYECQLRPRSGLALKKGISLVNTPGTIDADYRGEIGVILINLSKEPFVVENGERICQMVFNRFTPAEWEQVDTLEDTERGEGGFGHTGVK